MFRNLMMIINHDIFANEFGTSVPIHSETSTMSLTSLHSQRQIRNYRSLISSKYNIIIQIINMKAKETVRIRQTTVNGE